MHERQVDMIENVGMLRLEKVDIHIQPRKMAGCYIHRPFTFQPNSARSITSFTPTGNWLAFGWERQWLYL